MRMLDDPPLLLVLELDLLLVSAAAACAHSLLALLHAAPAYTPRRLPAVLGLGGG
jgi:hypothetical protein